MASIINFKKFGEYVDFNKDFIKSNPMLYYFLTETISRVFKGKVTLDQFFNIVEKDDKHVVALKIEDVCLLYSNGHTKEMVAKLSTELEFVKFKRYNFAGTKSLIDDLFELNASTYELNKHRIIYKCHQVSPSFTYSPGELQMGDIKMLPELTRFSVAFSKDYDGQNKTYAEMQRTMLSGIMNANLYQWNYNDKICAIAQVIHGDYDFPIIGHVYTNPEFRNKGYGASIVHRVTKGLVDAGNEFCMLAADATNPASNKAFTKVGYTSTGEYVRVYKFE